ncbi:MAG: hypothetical protein MZV64_09575 [Ignavibacteriales bacterium]|nr:hypothetical protein [Ignavibacteriales bacterium]
MTNFSSKKSKRGYSHVRSRESWDSRNHFNRGLRVPGGFDAENSPQSSSRSP